MVEVYVAELTEWLERGLPEEAARELSASRRERWERNRGNRGLLRSAAAELLLKRALGLRGVPVPEEWRWNVDENGKPSLGGLTGVEFNLSHSGRYAACALGERPVGVDVQELRDRGRTAERRFCREEREAIARSPDPGEMFCRIWAAKEAYLKLLGVGLRRPLSSFRVEPETGRVTDPASPGSACHLTWLPVWPGRKDAVLAVCARETCARMPVYLRAEELFEF